MIAKFKIGDKVRFTRRVTDHAIEDLRQRTRTIVDAHYDPIDQCTYYELHGKGKATLGFLFRSYMLKSVTLKEREKIGAPRRKRQYILRNKLLSRLYNQNVGDHPPRVVSYYPEPQDLALVSPSHTPTKQETK